MYHGRMRYRQQPSWMAALLLILGLIVSSLGTSAPTTSAQSAYLLSLNRPAYASSSEGGNLPSRAVDGNTASGWSSQWAHDPEWIAIDLGAVASISRVVLRWENAYGNAYQIQTSNDEFTWNTAYSTSTGDGGVDDLTFAANGRYVRLLGTQHALSAYGYMLFEFEVYGTGGANPPPPPPHPNLALNKPALASSEEASAWLPPGSTRAVLAVDGNPTTRWGSNPADPQWLRVDLGQSYALSSVVLKWETAYGRVYDIQVSNDASSWTTIYRQLHGMGGVETIPLTATGRYVRVYGYARGTGFGFSLFELEVYQYLSGDPQPTYPIPAIPAPSVTNVGSGSYGTDITLTQPRYPAYTTSNISGPLPSNDWWTSVLIKRLSDGIIPLPLKAQYTDMGLSIINPGAPWLNGDGGAIETGGAPDLYLLASNINSPAMSSKLDKYGDWSVDVVLSDNATPKMKTTFVKGSPYLFNTFSDPATPEIYSPVITRFFDDNNTPILTSDGAVLTTDHIGIEVTNVTGAPTPQTRVRQYGVFAPAGTVFRRVGPKLKIQLGGGQTYLSLATLPNPQQLNYVYQHAYAFVSDTKVSWSVDPATQKVATTFTTTTQPKRSGFSSTTLMGLFPHQWKTSTTGLTALSYPSVRGLLKLAETNSFSTSNQFYGITPGFGEPTGSSSYARSQMQTYLNSYTAMITADYWVADPYWQGKKLHTLSMAVLIADQIGDTATRDQLLGILRTILTNWYTYGGPSEYPYYFYYSPTWGTLNGDGGDHGMAINLSDHHFLWGYYTFSSAVLAAYDKPFMTQYGGIVEHLIRDYANPSRTDSLYPFMRNFDPYEGHSWAGGYGDNNAGNNQESASEALFAWAGMYMWGLASGNATYRDAGIWGFTLEEASIEQYWFDYDQDIWPSAYPHGVVGMVYGSAYLYGTYFSGDPNCIYGIHWLPTAAYLTAYGRNPTAASQLYQSFLVDKGGPEDGWQHIIWPFQALSDPDGALAKWNANVLQQDEVFNTYWFLHNMKGMGTRTMDVWATNWSSYSVFKKGSQYSAVVWNPTAASIQAQFRNTAGMLDTITVPAGKTVSIVLGSSPPQATPTPTPPPTSGNLALNKPASASAVQGGNTAAMAVDGNGGTRWESAYTDAQWLQVDLGATTSIGRVKLSWEGAYGKSYQIQVSGAATGPWTTIYSTSTGDGGIDDLTGLSGSGRYVRMNGILRGTGWGYSLWEFEVYAGSAPTPTPTATATHTPTPPPTASNLALNKPASASSVTGGNTVAMAVDGNASGTRWESAYTDAQWLQVDLGATTSIGRVKLSWEGAYGKSYQIQVSGAATGPWTTIYTTTTGDGGIDDLTVSGSGRYVRMNGILRGTGWGYSLWEFEVYAGSAPTATPTATAAPTSTPVPVTNLALNKPATTSSVTAGNTAALAVDDNGGTRWESAYSDAQWLQVDLGATKTIHRVVLNWEGAYGKSYQIQVSGTATGPWTTIYSTTTGDGGSDDLTVSGSGRYVRMNGILRGTGYGYSLWEFQVYGS